MKFDFRIIPHHKERYDSVGDYFIRHGVWNFRVSRMQDKRYCWLVFLHEIIEWTICKLMGVKVRDIDRFDIAYEKARKLNRRAPCGCNCEVEPGDDVHSPYFDAHQTATHCERLIASALGVNWDKYNNAVESL